MQQIILFSGPPGSGKDTAAIALDGAYRQGRSVAFATQFKFSEPLKAMACQITGLDLEELERFKDTALDILNGDTPRQLQIALSEEFIKPRYGKAWFGVRGARELLHYINDGSSDMCADLCVFSDSGFQLELDAFVRTLHDAIPGRFRILLVRLNRKGHTFKGDSRQYVKPPKVKTLAQYVTHIAIDNNGTEREFKKNVRTMVKAWQRGLSLKRRA